MNEYWYTMGYLFTFIRGDYLYECEWEVSTFYRYHLLRMIVGCEPTFYLLTRQPDNDNNPFFSAR